MIAPSRKMRGAAWSLLIAIHAIASPPRAGGEGPRREDEPPPKAQKPAEAEGEAPPDPDEPAEVAKVRTLLRRIDAVPRAERLQRWRQIDQSCKDSREVRRFLSGLARDESSQEDQYKRFVAAATVAGFGKPSRIGPNSLKKGTSLAWYIDIQQRMAVSGPRRLKLAAELGSFEVEVEPNAKNDLTFTEILWSILSRYKELGFRLEEDGTFLIYPMPRLTRGDWPPAGLHRPTGLAIDQHEGEWMLMASETPKKPSTAGVTPASQGAPCR